METVNGPYPYALMIPQSDTERLLEGRLNELGVRVERGVEVTSVSLRTDGGGRRASQCRRSRGKHLGGLARRMRRRPQPGAAYSWCDLCGPHDGQRLDAGGRAHARLSRRPTARRRFIGTRTASLWSSRFPRGATACLLICRPPASFPPTPTLEHVQALIDCRGPPGTTAFDPIWLAGFRINGRKVSSYRWGHAFLCGDAAHVHSPAGGQVN